MKTFKLIYMIGHRRIEEVVMKASYREAIYHIPVGAEVLKFERLARSMDIVRG